MAKKDVHERFLSLAGFEEDEMQEALSDWRRASHRLGLNEEDVEFATEEWIPAHYDVKLEGVRKAIGSYVKETIDLAKASEYKERGVKIVYGILPAILHYYYALKLTAPDKVYVSFPDIVLTHVLNGFFRKLNPYLEEAEKTGIAYGCRHCALNKTRYAAHKLGVIPSPSVSWIWGFVCDEGPKTDEFIQLYHNPEWKTYVTRIPHDQPLGTIEYEVIERVEYLASQMRDGFEYVQRVIGVSVPDEKIKEVMSIWHRYATKVTELNRLMAYDPQPLSGIAASLVKAPLSIPFNTGIESMEGALDILIREVKQRVANKEGILPRGAPKLMISFFPTALPWICKMFEQNGVGILFGEGTMPSKKQLEPPTFDDAYLAAAEAWLRRSAAVNTGAKAQIVAEKLRTYGMDGMIFGFFDFDRWIGSDHRLLSRMVEEETKLPVFYIEGDVWEDRDYSQEALRTRIETIAEIAKMRKV